MCPSEQGGASSGDDQNDPGDDNASISAIIWYLNHRSFGADGDFTGNAGFGGDNIGPPGSNDPPKDEASPGQIAQLAPESGDRRDGGSWPDPYGGTDARTGSLFAFVGMDVDVYSGLPLGTENLDPWTGQPAFHPSGEGDGPARALSATPFAPRRRSGLLSSRYLLADNTGDMAAQQSGDMAAQQRVLDARRPESQEPVYEVSADHSTYEERQAGVAKLYEILESKEHPPIGKTDMEVLSHAVDPAGAGMFTGVIYTLRRARGDEHSNSLQAAQWFDSFAGLASILHAPRLNRLPGPGAIPDTTLGTYRPDIPEAPWTELPANRTYEPTRGAHQPELELPPPPWKRTLGEPVGLALGEKAEPSVARFLGATLTSAKTEGIDMTIGGQRISAKLDVVSAKWDSPGASWDPVKKQWFNWAQREIIAGGEWIQQITPTKNPPDLVRNIEDKMTAFREAWDANARKNAGRFAGDIDSGVQTDYGFIKRQQTFVNPTGFRVVILVDDGVVTHEMLEAAQGALNREVYALINDGATSPPPPVSVTIISKSGAVIRNLWPQPL
ncbi:hypothetical protein EVC45_38185 [Paraburkholderia sp. UYCP14C]|uniref:hypothetical protein n=1 Tax=Paraburkholderia sp. UYCP14C TaxID=2511130 RepID=UPI001021D5A8|nr:hypothetical protein [Paraburkholderia sp. UYCP14C]RZF24565.1 hypothetical protein EVC45_38185 [Paraburkholderia sp. UYCP14C]